MIKQHNLKAPVVTIILPVYNMEQYIQICIESILHQSFSNFELIIIDDGSTDASNDICHHYAENDSRIRIVHQSNQGLSSARNRGIVEAKGEYICFIDSDDRIDERYLEILYQNAQRYHADMSFCHYRKWDGRIENQKRNITNEPEIRTRNELLDLLTEVGSGCRSGHLVVAWNKLIKSKIMKQIKFPEGKWHEDEFTIHHLLSECECIVETPAELYDYRQRDDSIVGSRNRYDIRHLDIVDAFQDRIKIYREIADVPLIKKIVQGYFFTIAVQYFNFYEVSSSNQNKTYRKICYNLRMRTFISLFSYLQFLSPGVLRMYGIFCISPNYFKQKYWS